MSCERQADERLQADKMAILYGEADAEVRERVEAHLSGCRYCVEELNGLSSLRKSLQAWRLPEARPGFAPRGFMIPRWLAAAAVLVFGVALGLGVSGYMSLRRDLQETSARAAALEERQRQTTQALDAALARTGVPGNAAALLTRLDTRLDERIRQSEAQQAKTLELRFTDWSARAEAQRRMDLARVAEGLSYLDGQHGQQLARTNELMSYVLLETAGQGR